MSPKRKAVEEIDKRLVVRQKVSKAPNFGIEIVTVEIRNTNTAPRIFVVHKLLLVQHSEYFAAALSRNWREGQQNRVILENEDAQIFDTFHNFIYTGKLFCVQDEIKSTAAATIDELDTLERLWIFGQQRLSTSLKDAVVDAIILKFTTGGESVPLGCPNKLYHNSNTLSAIRRLLVDMAVWGHPPGNVTQLMSFKSGLSVDFLHDLVIALDKIKVGGRKSKAPYEADDSCFYHDHVAEGKPCYKTVF